MIEAGNEATLFYHCFFKSVMYWVMKVKSIPTIWNNDNVISKVIVVFGLHMKIDKLDDVSIGLCPSSLGQY